MTLKAECKNCRWRFIMPVLVTHNAPLLDGLFIRACRSHSFTAHGHEVIIYADDESEVYNETVQG